MAVDRKSTLRSTRVGSGTARGLRRIPQYAPPEDERSKEKPTYEERKKRREIKHSLFSLGSGIDWPLLIFLIILLAFGLVMLFSASYPNGYYYEGDSYYYIRRQGIMVAVGVVAMLFISTFDYHHFHRLAWPIYGGAILLLLMVLLFKGTVIAPLEGDANRWLKLGPIGFQPSEVAKFALITMCAHHISQHADKMNTLRSGVFPFLWMIGIPAMLVMAENHLSGTIIILALGAILMLVGGTQFRYFVPIVAFVGAAVLFLVINKDRLIDMFPNSYQILRIVGWFDPFNPPDGVDTWQTRQSLYAIGSGGIKGVGLGQSRIKYLYLPEPQNDFIFAIVCEELGFIGALFVIMLFCLLIWRGMVVSINAKDRFGMLLGLGITFQIGLQVVLNICVVTNTLPNTGISLPFFSYGGTAMLMLLGEMGILLNISRSSSIEKT